MIEICFTRGLTELNFQGEGAPFSLREEGCRLLLDYIKLSEEGRVVKDVEQESYSSLFPCVLEKPKLL